MITRSTLVIALLLALSGLSACSRTDWNKVYSGMSNDGTFRK